MDESFRDLVQHSARSIGLAAMCLKPREKRSICKQGLRMRTSDETAILDSLQTKLQLITVVS